MTLHVTELEFTLLRDLIYERSGIFLTDNKTYLVETRLADLVKETRCATFGELYLKARSAAEAGQLCTRMVDAITTNETSWFRDQYPYRVLKEQLLPQFDKEIREGRRSRIRIWSAACSTGQEPYSIAITILDFCDELSHGAACRNLVRILATDISDSSLALASEGKYDNLSISRGLEQKHLDRYFRKDDKTWIVDDRVKQMVSFKACNLKDREMKTESFDIIFLRNVMIYFPDSLKRELLDGMAGMLAPDGYLFLGTGETVSGYTNRFDMVDGRKAIFYRAKAANGTAGNGGR
jgi:chemotaxis protein methyltransferase CheR